MSLVQNTGRLAQLPLSPSESPIACLPDELILNIFSLLDSLDLFRMALVCRQWKAISKDELLWKRLYLERKNPLDKSFADGFTYHAYMLQVEYMDRLTQHPPSLTADPVFYTYPWRSRLSAIMRENFNSFFSIIPCDAPLLHLGIQGDLAFFSNYISKDVSVHIVSLSQRSILAIIPVLDPIQCFLLPNNQLIIVTKKGIIDYWDISQISQPTHIERVPVFKDESRWIKNVVKIQNLLILPTDYKDYAYVETECFAYDLNEKKIFDFSRAADANIISGGDEIYLEFEDRFIRAYQFFDQDNKKSTRLIWEIKSEENSYISCHESYERCYGFGSFNFYQHQPDYKHPYFLYKEGESLVSRPPVLLREPFVYKVINTLNGTELLKIDSSELIQKSIAYGLIADIFFILSENEINFWLLPSCEHYKITQDVLPEGSKFQNIAWDGQTLVIQLLNESSTYDNAQILFLCYNILKKGSNLDSNQGASKTYFLKVGLTNLFQTIPLTMLFTFGKIIKLITLYHFWVPFLSISSEKIPYKRRLHDAECCLAQIIGIPLLVLGKQLAAAYGLISPIDGDQLINKIDRGITQLNMNTIGLF